MDTRLVRTIQGEDFIFDCRRVIYWLSKKTLLAADLHWGKTHYLRAHGIAVSDHVFEADLERLSEVITDYDVSSLIVLGDLIHHEKSLVKVLSERIERFRSEYPCEIMLLKGNHDRFTKFPQSWGVVEERDLRLDGFYLGHEYNEKINDFQFSGHVHPMFKVGSGVDRLRLPAFILSKSFCLVPAYSHLTGGKDMSIQKGEEALAVMSDGIISFKK